MVDAKRELLADLEEEGRPHARDVLGELDELEYVDLPVAVEED